MPLEPLPVDLLVVDFVDEELVVDFERVCVEVLPRAVLAGWAVFLAGCVDFVWLVNVRFCDPLLPGRVDVELLPLRAPLAGRSVEVPPWLPEPLLPGRLVEDPPELPEPLLPGRVDVELPPPRPPLPGRPLSGRVEEPPLCVPPGLLAPLPWLLLLPLPVL